jgi:hypothetical protein
MKKSTAILTYAACGLLFTALLTGQVAESSRPTTNPPSKLAPAELAWLNVRAAMFTPDQSKELPVEPAARKAAIARHAARFVAAADTAKGFYTTYPDHPKAEEGKKHEVHALTLAVQAGNATVEGRLNAAVESIRADKTISTKFKAQAISAYAFHQAMRGKKTKAERFAAIEQVARNLAADFPDQPQGYESLLTVALAGDDEANVRSIAAELLSSPSPESVKTNARALLGRLDLVGKPIAAEFDGADVKIAKAATKAGRATLIYTWASWSPSSLDLAAKLKKRGVNANVVALNLDEDTKAAEAIALKEGLLGTAVYDERGREGALAQRLSIKTAPQVIIVDDEGVIRDVRGEMDLTKKLQSLGL